MVASLLITLSALVANAQICSDAQILREAADFKQKIETHQVEFIQNCLQQALQKDAIVNKGKRTGSTSLNVQNIVAEIKAAQKQAEMAAYIKCISTDTPGCEEPESSLSDDELLDQDADLKAQGVEQDRKNGSRDW